MAPLLTIREMDSATSSAITDSQQLPLGLEDSQMMSVSSQQVFPPRDPTPPPLPPPPPEPVTQQLQNLHKSGEQSVANLGELSASAGGRVQQPLTGINDGPASSDALLSVPNLAKVCGPFHFCWHDCVILSTFIVPN